MEKIKIAIIGGTGVYDVEGIKVVDELDITTAWGKPSDKITVGEFQGHKVAFLPRHGKGHFISPTNIPQCANMAALKSLGVEKILAFSAVGSLKEEIKPTDFILPTQIVDRTRHRVDTFYNEGIVVHTSFGDPFCESISLIAQQSLKKLNVKFHTNETLICMEGPSFSTRAESKLYKSWGAGIINMSVIPEAKLARELEMAYQMVCMSTDYDSWREAEGAVTSGDIMAVVGKNSTVAKKLVLEILPQLIELDYDKTEAFNAVKFSVITAHDKRPRDVVAKYEKLLPGYFN